MRPVQKKQVVKIPPKKTEPKFELPEVKKWGIITGLIVFTFILYGNTIMHNYALDDDIITRRNEFVQQGVGGIGHIFSKGFLYGFNKANDQSYRPVTLTSIAIEKQFFGNNPHVHHFFNVFWYAITAAFLFLTLVKIFRKYNYIVPLVVTLLFIAHPVHTEVVANIKSRDEILSFLFCILALYFSLQYYCYKKTKNHEFLSWAFFFLAILSKETVLMYVLIIPMVYYFFTDFSLKEIIMIAIPYGLIVILYMIIRGHILDSITFNEQMEVINNALMAAKPGAERFATTFFVLGKYIWLLFIPITLTWDYSYKQIPIVSLSSPEALLPILIYVGLTVFALFRLKRKDPVSFGILYYIITMLLVSNLFVKIGSSMGERFLYTSSLGFCIAVTFLIIRLLKVKTDILKPNLTTLYAFVGVILLAFSVKTIARNSDWTDNFTLFEAGVVSSPNSARAHQSMGWAYTDTANKTNDPVERNKFFNKAIIEYSAALKILPGYSDAVSNLTWNYNSMGIDYFNQKNYPEAISAFEASLKISPNDAGTYGNLGGAFYNIGRYDSSIFYSQKALKLNPSLNFAKDNLSKAQNASRTVK